MKLHILHNENFYSCYFKYFVSDAGFSWFPLESRDKVEFYQIYKLT